jgi:hypothetical protein
MPRAGWSLLPLKNRSSLVKSLRAQVFCGLLLALTSVGLTSCHNANFDATHFPQFPFANRPIPPSLLMDRVMVAVSANGSTTSGTGSLQILDGLRDIRSNLQNTRTSFSVSGAVGQFPSRILSFPAEIRGYVYSSGIDGALNVVNYGTEAASTTGGGTFMGANSIAIPPTFTHIYAAEESAGQLGLLDETTGVGYNLNIPNVYQVAVNAGDTVALAMVRNSNTLYRVIKLNNNQFPTAAAAIASTGAIDCQPLNVPVYCAVPVNTGSAAKPFDRPTSVYFSVDGTTDYILNCGPECGGTTSSVTFLQESALNINTYTIGDAPNVDAFVSNVPVPGGATVGLSDGTTLYVAGQQLQSDGLFAGNLSTIVLANATTNPSSAVTGKYSISDGNHTKLLFADDNTLWVGSQLCSTGERAHQAAQGVTTQAANYNCLTRFDRGALSASIVPAVNQAAQGVAAVSVPFPNTNQNQLYYGDLTGLCWVQTFHKVYTAYGGQVHAFNTADGSEINNVNIIVQGTALDVAYMDAQTDADN